MACRSRRTSLDHSSDCKRPYLALLGTHSLTHLQIYPTDRSRQISSPGGHSSIPPRYSPNRLFQDAVGLCRLRHHVPDPNRIRLRAVDGHFQARCHGSRAAQGCRALVGDSQSVHIHRFCHWLCYCGWHVDKHAPVQAHRVSSRRRKV